MSLDFNGTWNYSSFRNDPIVVKNGEVQGNPTLATPWAPPGVLTIKTDSSGKAEGSLSFGPAALSILGTVSQATDQLPAGVDLVGEGLGAIYKVRGWYDEESETIVGTVLATANDIAQQPNGTNGPFLLVADNESDDKSKRSRRGGRGGRGGDRGGRSGGGSGDN